MVRAAALIQIKIGEIIEALYSGTMFSGSIEKNRRIKHPCPRNSITGDAPTRRSRDRELVSAGGKHAA